MYLLPSGRTTPPRLFNVGLLGIGKHPIGCRTPAPVVVGHVWSPDPDLVSEPPYLATDAVVSVSLPRTPFWSGADFEPQLIGGVLSASPTPDKGAAGQGQDDSLLIPDNGWELTLRPVPGEELQVTHHTYGHGSWVVSGFHSCIGLSGGWIVARRAHPTVPEAYFYDVSVEGSTHTNLLASDWEPRSVGDWCFLLRRQGADDLTFAANTPTTESIDSDILMLAPLSIMGEG